MISKSAMTPSFSGRMATMLPGRAAEHLLRLGADGEHAAAAARVLLHRDDRGLVADDALALDVDQGVGGAQIDRQIVGEEPQERIQNHNVILRRPPA